MDLTRLVLDDGALVTACGRVVSLGGRTWFEPALPKHLVYYPPGTEPAPAPSGVGVPVVGVVLARLEDRREKDAALEGWTCLTGEWRGGTLRVTLQRPWNDRSAERPGPSWETPPCPPPAAGWPATELEATEELEGPETVSVTVFHPTEQQVVVVVASEDPDATRRRLQPVLGDQLCVVPSTWSAAQVRRLRAELEDHWEDWGFLSLGQTADEGGQLVLTGVVRWVVPDLAALAAGVPEGLLLLDAWLRPA